MRFYGLDRCAPALRVGGTGPARAWSRSKDCVGAVGRRRTLFRFTNGFRDTNVVWLRLQEGLACGLYLSFLIFNPGKIVFHDLSVSVLAILALLRLLHVPRRHRRYRFFFATAPEF